MRFKKFVERDTCYNEKDLNDHRIYNKCYWLYVSYLFSHRTRKPGIHEKVEETSKFDILEKVKYYFVKEKVNEIYELIINTVEKLK